MDLRQLAYFVAVVDQGGFRAASRVLYVAQPAISAAIHRLETELGVALLHRDPRGILLTDAGIELLAYARAITSQADAAKRAISARAKERPVLRLGVGGSLGAGELTGPVIDREGGRIDGEVQIRQLTFLDQLGPVLDGSVDLALIRGPLDHPDLDVVPLALERRALMVARDHELADETEVSVYEIVNEPTVPLASAPTWSSFWQMDDCRGKRNVHPQIAGVTSIHELQMAAATSAMIISVPGTMSRLAPHALVRTIGLRDAEPSVIAIARRRYDNRPHIRRFIDHALSAVAEHIDLLPGGSLPHAPA